MRLCELRLARERHIRRELAVHKPREQKPQRSEQRAQSLGAPLVARRDERELDGGDGRRALRVQLLNAHPVQLNEARDATH